MNNMDKPNLFRRTVMLVVHLWRRIMDVKVNPLRHIPDQSLQAYFMVVLFVIWSVTFGFIATYYFGWLGYSTVTSVVVHLTILIPMMITNAVFIDAERTGEQWLEEWNEEQSKYKLFVKRMKMKNLVRWDIDKEA
ncbi:MAG: hypothetical protein HN470_06130 [Nitrosomonadales bacterium]|mgnify:CR=1 FL=1|jgi:hypothetical protein|nr:hypothetical protein [Nitrosomonadales bacterium]